ncbi:MAG TPA: radical SAM protein [bacterium]|nr:radical SAM protein [bacterium]
MKIYKTFLRTFYEIKRLVTGRPFIAEFDITDNCNLRCIHCYHFAETSDKPASEIPFEIWKERFESLYADGIRMVMLMGGEPMLRKDVVMLASEMFPFVEMITNGTIALPENYDHRIFVSIDGTKKTNDRIRGAGVFDKVVKNVSGDKRVVFNMTLMDSNYTELEYVVDLAQKIGVSGVVCNLFTTVGKNQEPLNMEIRKKITTELRRIKKLKPGILLFTIPAIEWFEKGDHTDTCHWRENVIHYTTGWRKRPCFASADCSNCGCFSGAMGSPFSSVRQFFSIIRLIFETSTKRG